MYMVHVWVTQSTPPPPPSPQASSRKDGKYTKPNVNGSMFSVWCARCSVYYSVLTALAGSDNICLIVALLYNPLVKVFYV